MDEFAEIVKNWEAIIQQIKRDFELSDTQYEVWIKPLQVNRFENGVLYIWTGNDNQIILPYIKKKYSNFFKTTIDEITGIVCEIEFVIDEPVINKTQNHINLKKDNIVDENTNLNPNYTFDTFVIGSNNRFAHSACLSVAESPGESYNPLFIYGGPGLGKTHLMQSIAHFIKERYPSMKVLYVSSETFTNEVIDAIRNSSTNSSSMANIRHKYRDIDILLVDDIQFIIGKESTQIEFFHTFNELHMAKKQIIITSDKPPKEMTTLDERFRSRFECGLLADIGIPDYETRMAILKKKEESEGINLEDEILEYIAMNIKNNVRELEGAVKKLVAYSNLEKTPITLDIAKRELANFISPDKPKEITPQSIIEVVSDHFQISLQQMTSKSRTKDISKPRQIAMYLCKVLTPDCSLEAIGSLLGGRDHTTILHGVDVISKEIETNEQLNQTIEVIRKKLDIN